MDTRTFLTAPITPRTIVRMNMQYGIQETRDHYYLFLGVHEVLCCFIMADEFVFENYDGMLARMRFNDGAY